MSIDLTTTARVKAVLDLTVATKDVLIADMIKSASQAIEEFMARLTKEEARTEQYDVEPGQQKIFLRTFPIKATPAATFKNDTAREFGVGIIAFAADTFYLDLRRGTVEFDRIRLIHGPGTLQVTYTGGMGTDTANFITRFPEIAKACDFQVATQFKRREQLGLSGFSAEGGSVSFEPAGDLIPAVKKAVRKYRRMHGGN